MAGFVLVFVFFLVDLVTLLGLLLDTDLVVHCFELGDFAMAESVLERVIRVVGWVGAMIAALLRMERRGERVEGQTGCNLYPSLPDQPAPRRAAAAINDSKSSY